jgi:hypothetical protein
MNKQELKEYKYKIPSRREERLDLNRLPRIKEITDPKPLTSWVHGKQATDIEERFARGLMKVNLEFRFQVPFHTRVSLPGQERVVDFVVESGFQYPVEVDGPNWHANTAERARDEVREILLNEVFRSIGYMPLQRVKWWQLESQAMADRVVREIFR